MDLAISGISSTFDLHILVFPKPTLLPNFLAIDAATLFLWDNKKYMLLIVVCIIPEFFLGTTLMTSDSTEGSGIKAFLSTLNSLCILKQCCATTEMAR